MSSLYCKIGCKNFCFKSVASAFTAPITEKSAACIASMTPYMFLVVSSSGNSFSMKSLKVGVCMIESINFETVPNPFYRDSAIRSCMNGCNKSTRAIGNKWNINYWTSDTSKHSTSGFASVFVIMLFFDQNSCSTSVVTFSGRIWYKYIGTSTSTNANIFTPIQNSSFLNKNNVEYIILFAEQL